MGHDPETRQRSAFERRAAALTGSRIFWAAFVAVVVSLPIAKALTAKLPPAPPKLRQIPAFRLTDQDGRPFGSAELQGKLWVVNFIYTSCGTICPRLTHAMAEVKHRARNLKGVVAFVSITVDPSHDTPEVLAAYVEKNHARGDWSFLTGSPSDVRTLVLGGFGLGLGKHGGLAGSRARSESLVEDEPDASSELFEVAHGQQLLLVDKDRYVRGSYAPDASGLNRLMQDLGFVSNMEGYSAAGTAAAPSSRPNRTAAPPNVK